MTFGADDLEARRAEGRLCRLVVRAGTNMDMVGPFSALGRLFCRDNAPNGFVEIDRMHGTTVADE